MQLAKPRWESTDGRLYDTVEEAKASSRRTVVINKMMTSMKISRGNNYFDPDKRYTQKKEHVAWFIDHAEKVMAAYEEAKGDEA